MKNIVKMTVYPPLPDYNQWLDYSSPGDKRLSEIFFPELTTGLNWPKTTYARPGSPRDLLLSLGVSPGDYIVLPNLCPIYWDEAARAVGADCILIDNHPDHWQLDLDLLEEFLMNFSMLNERDELILKKDSRIIRAIVVPHLLGGLCDMERLAFIGHRFNLRLGEDITQALGSFWNDQPAGSFGTVNYCDFMTNPILPFGQSIVFSAEKGLLARESQEINSRTPVSALTNYLGRQLVPKLPAIIEGFRKAEALYRRLIQKDELKWMKPDTDCQSNGLSAAFTHEKESLSLPGDLPAGRLAPPLYRQTPFQKSLYIRREDWAAKLYDKGVVLPLRFDPDPMVDKAIRLVNSHFL